MNGGLKDILQYNPYIDEVIMYQTAFASEYDCVLDVTSVCIGREKAGGLVPNRIDLFAEYMGVSLKKTGYLPDYIVSDEEKEWAQKKLARYPLRRSDTVTVGIQARASTMARSWPLEKVRELAVRLYQEHGMRVVVFDSSFGQGSMEDWNIVGVIPCLNYDIRHTAALINEMDLVIAPDSGLMHIAGALNKRLVTIWAGTDYRSRINHYPNASAVVRDEYKCWPCWYSPSACQKQYTCIRSISVDEVIQAVFSRLDMPFVSVEPRLYDWGESNSIYVGRNIGGVGDIVCITPAVAALKKRYPNKNIYIATPEKYHCIFDNNPHVAGCVDHTRQPLFAKAMYFDLTRVDTNYEVSVTKQKEKNILTRPEIYLKAVCENRIPNDVRPVPELYVTEEEISHIQHRFLSVSQNNIVYVLTCLSTAEIYRNWPIEHYLELFKMAEKYNPNLRFVLTDIRRPDWIPPSNTIDATALSLRKTIALVAACDVVLTPDTSILHMAAAFDKPCIALFGPIDAMARCRHYKRITPVTADMGCIPCWRNAEIPCKMDPRDGRASVCMQQLSPQTIYKKLISLIESEADEIA